MPRIDRPVIVTGTPKSGKSLVSRVISSSPEFLMVDEPLPIWNIGMPRRKNDRRFPEEADAQTIELIRHACAQTLSKSTKSRYLDHLSYHMLRIGFIHRVLPDARFILVTRHPGEVIPEMIYGWSYREAVSTAFKRKKQWLQPRYVTSFPRLAAKFYRNYVHTRLSGRRKTWGPRVPEMDALRGEPSLEMVVAHQWRQLVEIALESLRNVPTEQQLIVKQEDLLASPRQEAQRIGEFCEAKDMDAIINSPHAQPSEVHLNWSKHNRVSLSREQWNPIVNHITSTCEKLGYACPMPPVNESL